MSYKPLADVELLQESTENTNVLIEQNGKIRRVSKNEVGSKCECKGNVKTVNNIEPDENGNVQIETGGGVTSWNDLPDRPFGEGSKVLFDGEIELNDIRQCELKFALKEGVTYYVKVLDAEGNEVFNGQKVSVCDEWGDYQIDFENVCSITTNSGQSVSYFRNGGSAMGRFNEGGYLYFEYVNEEDIECKTLDDKYLPKALGPSVTLANGEYPTADEFNALLYNLRNAGYLRIE